MAGRKDIIAKQLIPQHLRYSFEDFLRQFPDNDACLEHIKEQRWPRGITYCETCKADKKHHRVTGRSHITHLRKQLDHPLPVALKLCHDWGFYHSAHRKIGW